MRFAFVAEDDEGKLVPLICAHLSLGQFELARASLRELWRCSPESAFSLLKNVIEAGPPPSWLSSKSVPSAGHLAHLSILEHDSLRSSSSSSPPAVDSVTRDEAEFEILLFLAFDDVLSGGRDVDWLEELRMTRTAVMRQDSSSSRGSGTSASLPPLSVSVVSRFRALIQRSPAIAAHLTARLSVQGDTASSLAAAAVPLHRLWLESTASMVAGGKLPDAARSLAHLSFSDEATLGPEAVALCKKIFSKLTELSDPLFAQQVRREAIYQSLLSAPSLAPLRCMCRAEEDYLRACAAESESVLPLSFGLLRAGESAKAFWSHYAFYSFANKVHFMEHALLRALALLRDGRLDDAALCVAPLPKLRTLLLLLGWDVKPQDAKFHSQLLALLWKKPAAEGQAQSEKDSLARACDKLAYQTDLSRWCAQKLSKRRAAPESGDEWAATNRAMALITEGHTIPFIVGECLPEIAPEEVTKMIEANPSVSPAAAEAKLKDVTVVRAHAILRRVLSFLSSSEADKDSAIHGAVCQDIASIKDPRSRTTLLQLIFLCLFLKDETGEFNVTAEKAAVVLGTIEACLEKLGGQVEQAIAVSVQRLKADVAEAKSRLKVATKLYGKGKDTVDGQKLPPAFARTMIAEANALATLAMQFSDYHLASEVVGSFPTTDPALAKMISLDGTIDQVVSSLNATGVRSSEGATSRISSFQDAAAIAADIAMRAGSLSHATELLDFARDALSRQGEPTPGFSRTVELIRVISSHARVPPAAAISSLDCGPFAKTADDQKALLQSREARSVAQRVFLSMASQVAARNKDFNAENAIAGLRRELSRIHEKSVDFIGSFLYHIVSVTEVLRGSDMPLHFELLSKSPASLVHELVFARQNYDVASRLASSLRLDLDTILIEKIAGPRSSLLSERPAKRGPEESLSLHVAKHIGQKWPALAATMCLLAFPVTEFHPELLRYATTIVEAGSLKAWASRRKSHFEVFAGVFCHATLGTMEKPAPLDEAGQEALRLLSREDEESVEQFYRKAVERLCAEGKHGQALELADDALFMGASDALLIEIAGRSPEAESWRYLMRLKDKSRAAPLVLKGMQAWDVEASIDMLSMCDGLPEKDPSRTAVSDALAKMKIYRDVLALKNSSWKSWPEVEEACTKDGVPLIRGLIQANQFDLARRIQRAFVVKNVKSEIEEGCLIHLLLAERDSSVVLVVLSEMKRDVVHTVQALLEKLASADMDRTSRVKASLFLVQFLLTNMRDILSEQTRKLAEFELLEVGLRGFLLLPEDLQAAYEILLKTPTLLVENMLMDGKLEEAAVLFRALPKLRDDAKVIAYAKKALDFSGRRVGATEGTEQEVQPSARFTGDPEVDQDVRRKHAYPNTPNVNLAKALFDLGDDPVKIGEACIEVCNQLATGLTEQDPRAEETMDVIARLLSYAKTVLQRGGEGAAAKKCMDGIVFCDSFLSAAEVFGVLLRNRCAFGLSLHDILQIDKARWLRDKLIDADLLRLAVDFAARCNLAAGKVWARWGFAMLNMGRYSEAREKFKFCLAKNFKRRGIFDDDPDPEELLAKIVDTLEVEPEIDEAAVRSHIQQVQEDIRSRIADRRYYYDYVSVESYLQAMRATPTQDGTAPQRPQLVPLAEAVLAECVFYLKSYGSPRQLVSFFMKRGMVDDAVKYSLEKSLPPQQFHEEVVAHSLSHSDIPALQRSMRTADTSLAKLREYLLYSCKFFSKHQAFEVLMDFQMFMGDFTRAGLTALHMFLATEPLDFPRRIQLLEAARHQFEEAIAAHSPDSVLSDADISIRLRGADAQIMLLKFFQKNVKLIPPDVMKLTVFGNTKDRMALAEQAILLGNYDIAFQLLQHFRLPGGKLYASAARSIARSKQSSRVFDMLKHIKGTIPDSEWDNVVIAGMTVFSKELNDVKTAEKLLSRLVSNRSRARGQALCGNFKGAYMSAVGENFIEEVEFIMQEAEAKDPKIAAMCQRYLESHKGVPEDALPPMEGSSGEIFVDGSISIPTRTPSPGQQSVGIGVSLKYGGAPGTTAHSRQASFARAAAAKPIGPQSSSQAMAASLSMKSPPMSPGRPQQPGWSSTKMPSTWGMPAPPTFSDQQQPQ